MRKHFQTLLAIVSLLSAVQAVAGTQVIGVEVGVTTSDQLKSDLSKRTKIEDRGENKFTNGAMLRTDGASYEIEGLTDVLYIFDEQKKLAGVLMTMNKARFDSVFQFLSSKYKVTAQQRPFVGDQFARFKPADAVIEMDAPHLGFTMEVRYIRNDLMEKYNAASAAEAAAKKKSEAAKF